MQLEHWSFSVLTGSDVEEVELWHCVGSTPLSCVSSFDLETVVTSFFSWLVRRKEGQSSVFGFHYVGKQKEKSVL